MNPENMWSSESQLRNWVKMNIIEIEIKISKEKTNFFFFLKWTARNLHAAVRELSHEGDSNNNLA